MSIALLPAVQQLALLREKKISPLELAEEHIQRIERLNPTLNALVDFSPDRIREQARSAPQGFLSGLPITIKSSIATRGCRCEIGSRLHQGHIPDHDADAVARLRSAGAIILGTTNCPEFLMAYETDNLLYGRTNNPWALDRTPGGSSGGEAAAIAAGLSAAGLGSDSGGSVREPAHFSGICSLKPTAGRVPASGHLPPCVGPFSTLGSIGPMARTIADVELLFRILATPPHPDPATNAIGLRELSTADAKYITIGYFDDDESSPVTPETRSALRNAARSLQAQGFNVELFRPPSLDAAQRLWDIFFVQCGAMFYEPTIRGREHDLSPIFQEFLAIANARTPLTASTLLDAWAQADLVRANLLRDMQPHPVLLLPVCATPAFRHGERAWTINGRSVEYLDSMRFTQWFNLTGGPAAAVPISRSADGLPIGVQVAGRPYDDELVLAIAGALDREFGYHPPPLS